jgi:hypothetical protein
LTQTTRRRPEHRSRPIAGEQQRLEDDIGLKDTPEHRIVVASGAEDRKHLMRQKRAPMVSLTAPRKRLLSAGIEVLMWRSKEARYRLRARFQSLRLWNMNLAPREMFGRGIRLCVYDWHR